jgi:hypothetical protein
VPIARLQKPLFFVKGEVARLAQCLAQQDAICSKP